MQVSRYIAPFSQQSLISAMLETSTETLIRKSPRPSSGLSIAAEVLASQALLDEADAVAGGLGTALVLGGHDGDALGSDADVPQDQRQHALADAAEADDENAAGKLYVDLVLVS